MDTITHIVGIFVGLVLLAVIAFPESFIPANLVKKMKVGATYWGCYADESPEEPEDKKTFEVKIVKKKEHVIGGSTRYAAGRGISFRGQ